ncbi:MAG: hypothetical protein QOD84_1770 [Acidobacteriaceae bacterium]|jgi:hypothetical protein
MLHPSYSNLWFWRLATVLLENAGRVTMAQEVSISYQAVKSKVYRLIDALVEDAKSEGDIQESVRRWWKLIHPSDRPVARKYLLSVLEKSNASLSAITDGLHEFKDFDEVPHLESEKLPKIHPIVPQARMISRV